jgi:hypothetical protein
MTKQPPPHFKPSEVRVRSDTVHGVDEITVARVIVGHLNAQDKLSPGRKLQANLDSPVGALLIIYDLVVINPEGKYLVVVRHAHPTRFG